MTGSDDPLAQAADVQDLVTLLLHAVVQTGDTLERLDRLAALCPAAGRTAATDIAQAIQLMSGARSTLIRCVDELAAGPEAR